MSARQLHRGTGVANSRTPKTPPTPLRPRTPPTPKKKDLWWIDDKITAAKQEYDAKFNQRLPKEAAYAAKMAKLRSQRERELVGKSFKRWNKEFMEQQSGFEGSYFSLAGTIDDSVVCSLAEDIAFLTYNLYRSRSVMDYVVAALSFVKTRVDSAYMQRIRNDLVDFVRETMKDAKSMMLQAGVEDTLESSKNVLSYWPRLKSSPLWRKVNTVVAYSTALTFWGDKATVDKARRIEETYYRYRGMAQMDFIHSVLDLLLFIADRGTQVVLTKGIDPMFHSGASYEKWYDEAAGIIGKSKFLSNPGAHGIDVHTFLSDLDALIAKGESMHKYACELDKSSKGIVRGMVAQLLQVRAVHVNKKTAQKTRKAPLVLIVEGHSSVAKTTFANVCHYYYGTLVGKNVELGSRYTRMSTTEFWDGFTSDQWSLLLDDIAFLKPGVTGDVDPTLKEMLQINNNAPLMPNMAAIEEKGAAPFIGELVVATTNTPDLNLSEYFQVPGAVARRFPYHVRIRPKPSLRKNDTMMDEKKLKDIIPGEYPDWWTIEILEPVPVPMSMDPEHEWKMTSVLESVHQGWGMKQFLAWYHDVIVAHNTVQTRVAASEMALRATRLCSNCHLPTGMCGCVNQAVVEPLLEAVNEIVCDVPEICPLCQQLSAGCKCEDPVEQAGIEWATAEPPAMEDGWWRPYSLLGRVRDVQLPLGDFIFGSMWQTMLWWVLGFTWSVYFTIFWSFFGFAIYYQHLFVRLYLNPMGFTAEALAYLVKRMFWRTHAALNAQLEVVVDTSVEAVRAQLSALGDLVRKHKFPLQKLCSLIVSVLVGVLAVYSFSSFLKDPALEQQGNILDSVGTKPSSLGEEENVWKHQAYTPSHLDIGRRSLSWKNMDEEKLCELISNNCVMTRFRSGDNWKIARCFGIGGQYYLTTNHSIPDFEGELQCHIIRQPESRGPSGNAYFRLPNSDVHRIPGKDLVLFRCRVVPPARDVSDLFIRERLTNFRGKAFYYGRARDGKMLRRDVGYVYEDKYYNPHIKQQTKVWWGKSAEPTSLGECGSILIAKSGSGPIIVGLHQLGSTSGTTAAIKVTHEDLQELIGDWHVVADAPPMLDAPTTNVGEPGELHPKSPLYFMEEGTIDAFGSFAGFRAAPKFNVQRSIAADFLEQAGKEFHVTHCAPMAKGWEPKYKALTKVSYMNSDVSPTIVDSCVRSLVRDWLRVDDKWKVEAHQIFDIHTAVNGVPGIKYVDGIKRNTSAGFPWGKPKQVLLEQLEPTFEYPDHVKVVEEVEVRIEEMLTRYQQGSVAGPVFKTAFKNEPLPIAKAKTGKVRAFTMSCIEMTVIMRMYLLPFVRIAQSNHYTFEMAPGMEAQSCEWDGLRQFLTTFGEDRNIAGDFQDYDMSAHPVFILAVFDAIALFLQECGASQEHIKIVKSIGHDIAFAYVDFFGDLVRMFGKNPSGQALTAIVNSIMNSLYMRYVFVMLYDADRLGEFQELVKLMTYGDDNAMCVSPEAPEFNHTSIQTALSTIGVVYTMADKETESVPYVPITQVSFLKRGFLWCPETGTFLAPLEKASINKMLMVTIPSSVVSPEVQMIDTIRSANSEYFFHGREVFEEYHRLLEELIVALGLESLMLSQLESWQDLLTRYCDNSRRYLRTCNVPFIDTSKYTFLMQEESGNETLSDEDSCDEPDVPCARCGDVGMAIEVEHFPLCILCHSRWRVYRAERRQLHIEPEPFLGECPCGCGVELMGCTLRLCAHCGHPRPDDFDDECPHCDLIDTCEMCQRIAVDLVPAARVGHYVPQICGVCKVIENESRVIAAAQGPDAESDDDVVNQSIPGSSNPPNHNSLSARLVIARRLVTEPPAARPTIGAFSGRNRETDGVPGARSDRSNARPTNQFIEEFVFQSGVEHESVNTSTGNDVMTSSSASTSTQQTAVFVDGGVGDSLHFGEANEQAFTYDRQNNADLGDFLSRPRLISTVLWTPGVLSNTDLDPWTLYLNTTEIKYKLNNFAYFRGKLKVKVIVNAAPFYYGALMMYYTPLPNSVGALSSTTGVKIQQSQRPHIWILPQNNEGGEMTLPFLYPANYVALTSAAAVATLGKLTLTAFTQLSSANGATSNGVQLQVYAWMEDVSLFGPTVGLAMQAGDEYGNGPVSAPAASAAHWATYMSKVPYIGRFAKATGIGASAVSQIAKLFGWSNVPVIEDVRPFKNVPFHDLASAHISEPTTKFMLDPKGELSVDPGLMGLSQEDELSVSFLVQKESYLATGTWTAGGAAGALIFSTVINPMLGDRGTASSGGTYSACITPMAWVGAAFAHWRGDLIFRFKVVCSKFHSGRLRIHWDPVSSLASTSDYTHVTYTSIIDLQESDEAEFRVPYMQALPWLGLQNPYDANLWSTSTAATPSVKGNGTLTVRVLNNLTAPVDTAVCSVLVFVKGAENLEFANPRDLSPSMQLFSMQSGTEPCTPNAPFDERYLVNWGEPVPSVRLLLRRSSLVDRITLPRTSITATDESGVFRLYQSRLPPPPGYDPTAFTQAKGVETPATTYPFSFTNPTYLSWFASAFVALRGSTRWHYNMVNPDGTIPHNISIVRRVGNTIASGNQGLESTYITCAPSTANTQSLLKGKMWYGFSSGGYGCSGMALTNPLTQTGVSVEYPMMTNYLFQFAQPSKWLLGTSTDGSDTDNYILEVDIHPAAGVGLGRLQLQRFAAAGTDFTLHCFLNTPVINFNVASGAVPV